MFGTLLTGVDHIRHTHDLARNAFSRGQPEHGAELADDLERLVALHDASTIAAVIVEPVAGSTGVLIPPKGYLERLREICDKHGILLIFDEVITGFGRLGAPFAADYFGVTPDIMTTAKGVTNGVVPMGAVFVKKEIHDAFMNGPGARDRVLPRLHLFGQPGRLAPPALAHARHLPATRGCSTRGAELADYWADALHCLKGLPHVIDIRNLGLVGAIELEPIAGAAGQARLRRLPRGLREGLLIRTTGDIIALSPPLIVEKAQIDDADRHARGRPQDASTDRGGTTSGQRIARRHRTASAASPSASGRVSRRSSTRRPASRSASSAALDRGRGRRRRAGRQGGASRLGPTCRR